jgi:hypothetical protein
VGELYQNFPNPFNENTTIKFKLSSDINTATLFIYDIQGNQLSSYLIDPRSDSFVVVKGSDLTPGMYLYSLIADGALIDTKTMILTD